MQTPIVVAVGKAGDDTNHHRVCCSYRLIEGCAGRGGRSRGKKGCQRKANRLIKRMRPSLKITAQGWRAAIRSLFSASASQRSRAIDWRA
jgi:hypothetical protein